MSFAGKGRRYCAAGRNLMRYNLKRDAALEAIAELIKGQLKPGQGMIADLPTYRHYYPLQVGTTDLHPAIMSWQNEAEERW